MLPVCVVGAGSSGLPALKVLRERGLPAVCFEVGSGIGGNWRYANDNGMSSAYRSLHINTNRWLMAYADYPMPKSLPAYPNHRQILAYFEAYADRFGLRELIRFRTRVDGVRPLADGTFEVGTTALDTGETHTARFGAVLVANGHHWHARRPRFEGAEGFAGRILHSHDYKTPDVLAGRRVVVVGVGNSGADIACEAVRHAERVLLSTRRGAHVVPKYLFGRPTDSYATPLLARLPWPIVRRIYALVLLAGRGPQKGYGFPTPPYPFGSEHPTISSELLDHVAHGRIEVRPEIARLDGNAVFWADGRTDEADVVVAATGYDIRVPFLSPGVFNPEGNRVRLYRHVAHPHVPGLYFIGLVQPLGAIMPLAEAQSEWVADLLEGTSGLPSPAEMEREIGRTLDAMARRYQRSPRHTVQVDFFPYLHLIARERRASRQRPARQALARLVPSEGAPA